MGGLGSGGGNHSGRGTVEASAKLEISSLRKAGGLRPGARTIWHWSRGGEAIASIGVHGVREGVRLSYGIGPDDGPPRHVEEAVALVHRRCRFGGVRAFFLCPRCARAVLNLHLRGGRFTCRVCGRLTYASRRERERDRYLRFANKLRRRLGGEEGAFNAAPLRPKGMWRRTYQRIVGEIARREDVAMEELAGWVMKLGGGSRRPAARFW